MGYPTPKLQNPIEHYLDVTSANATAAADYYDASPLASANNSEIARLKGQQYSAVRYSENIVERPWYDQIKLVGARCLQRYWRNPSTSWGRLFMFTCLALIFGGLFFSLTNDLSGARNRLGVASTFGFLSIYVAVASVPQFLEDRELYLQELDSAFYSTVPYWLTYLIIEGMFTTVITTIQVVIIWFMAGFEAQFFGPVYPMLLVQMWLATAVAQAWSAWSKTLVQAYTALWASGLIFFAFSGGQAALGNVSPALRWIADINYWRWCLQYVIWQIMRDYIMECPTIPSATFAVPVSAGYANAMNATFLANPGNDVQVAQFWGGVRIMESNFLVANSPLATPATRLNLLTATGGIAAGLAPITNNPSNFSDPGEFGKSIFVYPLWNNATRVIAGIFTDGAAFPPGYYCPIGQGRDFILKFRDVGPDNPATTNVAYGVAVALFAFYALMGLTGLMFSRNYRKR